MSENSQTMHNESGSRCPENSGEYSGDNIVPNPYRTNQESQQALNLSIANQIIPSINNNSAMPSNHPIFSATPPSSTRNNVDIHSINGTIRSSNQQIYKKTTEIARILPEFSGQTIPVNEFIRKCRDAERFIDPLEKDFYIKVVESRVVGNAKLYLQYKNVETLNQLFEELKRNYAPKQNLPQVQAELASIRQNLNEGVSDYGLRTTKILHTALQIINETCESSLIPGMTIGTIGNAVACFTTGLQKDIFMMMNGQKQNNLESVIAAAIICENSINQREKLHKNSGTSELLKKASVRTINNEETRDSLESGPRCYSCDRNGHYARDCNTRRYIDKTCYRCGLRGHIAPQCRKHKRPNESDNKNELSCNFCKLTGHTFDQCRKRLYYSDKGLENRKDFETTRPLNSDRVRHTDTVTSPSQTQ